MRSETTSSIFEVPHLTYQLRITRLQEPSIDQNAFFTLSTMILCESKGRKSRLMVFDISREPYLLMIYLKNVPRQKTYLVSFVSKCKSRPSIAYFCLHHLITMASIRQKWLWSQTCFYNVVRTIQITDKYSFGTNLQFSLKQMNRLNWMMPKEAKYFMQQNESIVRSACLITYT